MYCCSAQISLHSSTFWRPYQSLVKIPLSVYINDLPQPHLVHKTHTACPLCLSCYKLCSPDSATCGPGQVRSPVWLDRTHMRPSTFAFVKSHHPQSPGTVNQRALFLHSIDYVSSIPPFLPPGRFLLCCHRNRLCRLQCSRS